LGKADKKAIPSLFYQLDRYKGAFPCFLLFFPTYNRADIAFVRGEGSHLIAEDGEAIIWISAPAWR